MYYRTVVHSYTPLYDAVSLITADATAAKLPTTDGMLFTLHLLV